MNMTDYDALTVAQLKELLREQNLTTSGKKADLIARLKESASSDEEIVEDPIEVSDAEE